MSPNCLEPRLGHCFGLNGASKIGLVCWSAMAAVHFRSDYSKLFTKHLFVDIERELGYDASKRKAHSLSCMCLYLDYL